MRSVVINDCGGGIGSKEVSYSKLYRLSEIYSSLDNYTFASGSTRVDLLHKQWVNCTKMKFTSDPIAAPIIAETQRISSDI